MAMWSHRLHTKHAVVGYLDIGTDSIYSTVHCSADSGRGTIYYGTYSGYKTIDEYSPSRHCREIDETM